MFEEGQRVKVLVDEAYGTERGMLGREGTVLHNDKTSNVVTYVKMDGANKDERYVRGRRTACEVFGNDQLEIVEKLSEFEVGQKVRAKENGLSVQVGDVGVVTETFEFPTKYVARVKFPSSKNDYKLGSLFLAEEIEAITEKLEEEAVQEIKVGDIVKVIDTTGGHGKKLGETFKVRAIEQDRYSSKELIVLDDPSRARCAAYAERFKVVQPKPEKVKSQKITVDQVQKGDLIVAFHEGEGAEHRIKGVADNKDWEGDWRTAEGRWLTYFDGPDARAQNIYLLNRPEPKKPEIEDGTYWVTEEGHHASPWKVTVANEKAEWETKDGKYVFGTYENLVAVKSGKYESGPVASTKFHTEEPVKTLADGIYTVQWRDSLDSGSTYYWVFKGGKAYEHSSLERAQRKADNGSWEVSEHWVKQTVAGGSRLTVPVPYVEPKPKLTAEDLVGKKYRHTNGLDYKVTAKGNVKVRFSDRTVYTDSWERMGVTPEDVLGYIESGKAVKI